MRRADEFLFLDGATISYSFAESMVSITFTEIIPLQAPEPPAQRKPKALQEEEKEAERAAASGPLDRFITGGNGSKYRPADSTTNIVMNDDGTMSIDS